MTSPSKVLIEPTPRTSTVGFARRIVLSIVLCIVAIGLGLVAFTILAMMKEPPESRERIDKIYNVDVFEVDAAGTDLQEILSAFGTAKANREVVVAAQVSGEIVEVHPTLKVGEQVETLTVSEDSTGKSQRSAGDLLVVIDPSSYQKRVTQAEDRLAEDEIELARLKQEEENNERVLGKVKRDHSTFSKEYQRTLELSKRKAATQSQLARADLELRKYEDAIINHENEKELYPLRRAQVLKRRKTHQTDLQLAQLDLQHTEVFPPFAGTLSETMVELGRYVRVGDPLVRLTDDQDVEIPIPLTLKDFAKIEANVKAGIYPRVELAENETDSSRWTGSVVRVAPEADELTRTINAYVHVENEEQTVPLLPGTFVHARIVGPVLEKKLVIPRDAIVGGKIFVVADQKNSATPAPQESESKQTKTIWVGTAEERPVTVEQTLQSLAVISVPISAGETALKVILTNLDIIQTGTVVRYDSTRKLTDGFENSRARVVGPSLTGSSEKPASTVN